MARPKKTTEDLPKEWKEEVLTLSAKGYSINEIRLHYFNISIGLYYALCKRDEEFLETIKKAKDLCEGWWSNEGRKSLRDKDFNPTLWYMNMKNRFGWKDKQEIESESIGNLAKALLNLEGRSEKN